MRDPGAGGVRVLSLQVLGYASLPGHRRGGLHLVFFRREYDEILRKAVRLFPFARQPTLAQRDPRYILPLGIAYTLFGVASALLVIFA